MENPRRKHVRSDSSSIHSSNTRKTSASQSTIKRGHAGDNPKTALISVKKPSPKQSGKQQTQFLSTKQFTKTPPKTKPNQTPTKDNTAKTQATQGNGKLVTNQRKQGISTKNLSSNIVTIKRPSPLTKTASDISNQSVTKKNGTTKKSTEKHLSGHKSKKVNSNTGPDEIVSPRMEIETRDAKNDGIGQNTVPLRQTLVAQANNLGEAKTHIENNSLVHDPTSSKEHQTHNGKMTSAEIVTELDLHSCIVNCEWEKMYSQLKELSTKSNILSTLNAMSKEDATVLHACCWKAPAGLTLIVIKLLPLHGDEAKSIFLTQDKDGNTPIHLCAANMMPFYDENSLKTIIDISVLECLITAAPEALLLRNKVGDTPLHLFVTSHAASVSSLSSIHPTPELSRTSLKALTKLLDNLGETEISEMKDILGSTPFHSALTSPTDESILSALLDRCPSVCKVEDGKGMIPLHYVAAFLITPVAIVKNMISIYQYGLCHKTKDGDTPLHILVRNSADDVDLEEIKAKKTKLFNRNAIEILQMLMGNTGMCFVENDKHLNEEYDPYFIKNNESVSSQISFLLSHYTS